MTALVTGAGVRLLGLYAHLKAKAMNGGRDKLTPDELEFVGAAVRVDDTTPDKAGPGRARPLGARADSPSSRAGTGLPWRQTAMGASSDPCFV